jgi:hypothetical protein
VSAINRLGFVLKDGQGQILHDSTVSALSKRPVYPGCPRCAVPGVSGLFIRLLPREDRQITDEQRADLYRQAAAWRDTVDPVKAEPPTPVPAFSRRKPVLATLPSEPAEPSAEAEE